MPTKTVTTIPTPETPTVDPESAAIQSRRAQFEAQLPAARAALQDVDDRLAAVQTELAELAQRTAPPVAVDEFGQQTFYPNRQHPAAAAIVAAERERLDNARKHLEEARLPRLAAVRTLEAQLARCDQEARQVQERRAHAAAPPQTPADAVGSTDWLRGIRANLDLAAHPERLPAPPEPKRVLLTETWWYVRDYSRVVPDGDPEAATLLGRAGCITEIDAAELERLHINVKPVPAGVG